MRAGAYDGPPLAWAVTACKAPDDSYWALQSWQRMLPNLGETPWKPGGQSVWELHLSHWTGETAEARNLNVDWSYSGRFHHVFGNVHLRRTAASTASSRRSSASRSTTSAARLSRHVRLRLRLRLEARELVPGARRGRQLLLRLLPAPARPRATRPQRTDSPCGSRRQGVPRDTRSARA